MEIDPTTMEIERSIEATTTTLFQLGESFQFGEGSL
jgi:hypothetical protein